MPFPFAPIVAGLGTALNFISGNENARRQEAIARENTDKTIRANREMAELAYQRDLEQWNRANAYDSPTAQMERLRSAGLNPMMAYGSGNVAGNSTTTSPKYQAPSQEYNYKSRDLVLPELASGLAQYQSLQLQQAQIDNVKAQTKAVQQETANKVLIGTLNEIKTWYAERRERAATTAEEAKALQAHERELLEKLLTQSRLAAQDNQNTFFKQSAPYQLEMLKGSVEQQKQATKKIMGEIQLMPFQKGLMDAQKDKTLADTASTWQGLDLIKSETDLKKLQAVLGNQDLLEKKWNLFIRQSQGLFDGVKNPWELATRAGTTATMGVSNASQKAGEAFEAFLKWLVK